LENGYDYVNITEGRRSLGVWSGSESPPPLQSFETELTVTMTSDHSIQNTGFLANYSRRGNSANDRAATESWYFCTSNLGSGQLTSPGYPHGYPRTLRYTWIIMQPEGCTIQLNFTDFMLEDQFDFVSVHNVYRFEEGSRLGQWSNLPPSVKSTSSRLLLEDQFRFCSVHNVYRFEEGSRLGQWSNLPPSVKSTSSRLLVAIRTDGPVARKGFSANYNTRRERDHHSTNALWTRLNFYVRTGKRIQA
ncbi:hypothetical protein T265_13100, partial [Opisthorchis viverrini]